MSSRNYLFLLLYSVSFSLAAKSKDYDGGQTPLMHAALARDCALLQKLIKEGAGVNDVAFRDFPCAGNPVLRYAIDSHSIEAVRVLLQAGACPNYLTVSPVYTKAGADNIRNLSLLSHAINTHAPLCIVEELIKYGAHVDGTPKMFGDWSALMVAAYRGYTEVVNVLLAAGADPASVNSMIQKTALEYAKEKNHVKITEILKAYGLKSGC